MKELWLKTDLMSFPEEIQANPDMFLQDDRHNRIGVELYKSGLPFIISNNHTVTAFVILPDGTTTEINQNATINRNKAFLTLPNSCYNQTGPIQIALRLKQGSNVTTIGLVKGYIYPTSI